MVSVKGAIVGFFSGVLFVLAWVVFIDGQVVSHDKFPPNHLIPTLFATLAAIMVNMVSINYINNKVKVWLFVWFTVHCVCIGVTSYILATDYSPEDNYAGIALFLQTIIMLLAGILFFIGRKKELN